MSADPASAGSAASAAFNAIVALKKAFSPEGENDQIFASVNTRNNTRINASDIKEINKVINALNAAIKTLAADALAALSATDALTDALAAANAAYSAKRAADLDAALKILAHYIYSYADTFADLKTFAVSSIALAAAISEPSATTLAVALAAATAAFSTKGNDTINTALKILAASADPISAADPTSAANPDAVAIFVARAAAYSAEKRIKRGLAVDPPNTLLLAAFYDAHDAAVFAGRAADLAVKRAADLAAKRTVDLAAALAAAIDNAFTANPAAFSAAPFATVFAAYLAALVLLTLRYVNVKVNDVRKLTDNPVVESEFLEKVKSLRNELRNKLRNLKRCGIKNFIDARNVALTAVITAQNIGGLIVFSQKIPCTNSEFCRAVEIADKAFYATRELVFAADKAFIAARDAGITVRLNVDHFKNLVSHAAALVAAFKIKKPDVSE
jgi:hypothetical protein